MKLSYWEKTDNSGMLYPLILTLSTQSNFEFCVCLSEDVNPEKLKDALEKTYARFRFAKVELQNNLFRSCFVENNREVVVHKNTGKLLGRIDFAKNNNYPVEVSYIGKEIHFKFFHALSDGTGASVFIRYLVIEYAKNSGVDVVNDNQTEKPGEHENAYQRYLDRSVSKKGLISNMKSSALQVKGKFFHHDGLGLICGELPLADVIAVSKKYNTTITVLLGALAMQTVEEIYGDKKQKPTLFIPVNLRKFFQSNTLLNFVSSAKCVLPPDLGDLSNTVGLLKTAIDNELSTDNLKKALLVASTVATNPVTKFCPFFLKRELITLGREFVTKSTQTMILSNIGAFDFPKELGDFVTNAYFCLNCNRRTPVNMSISSYNGVLSICFTRHIFEKKIEKLFFEKLRSLGLDAEIHSNFRENDYDL